MTPTPDFSENRRSFVKKTLATTVSISFAGLIRAHGEGTTGSTSNPDETTAGTTDSGGTTTWNPEESTYEITGSGGTTTWNPEETFYTTEVNTTTWNPDATTYETTPATTTGPDVVEVVKSNPTGTEDISATSIPAGKIVVKNQSDSVIYECELEWKVD